MSNVQIGDILPYTQAFAIASQTVFGTNWTANAASDVVVYQTPSGDAPDDVTQILAYPADYSVAFIGAQQEVQVTLVTGAGAGDIITITRQTPADRENLYTNTNFTPSMLNNDFGILTLVDQQAQLVNQLIGPRYNYSAIIVDVVDTILPILGANQIWVKNSGNTAIIPLDVPSSGFAPTDATYVLLTPNAGLPNAQALSNFGANGILVFNNVTQAIVETTIQGTLNQINVTNGAGVGTIGLAISNNPIMPGTAGMGIPEGTTAQRVTPGSNISLRYNTTVGAIEYYNGVTWVQIAEDFNVNPGLINELAFYAASGSQISGLPTAADGVLVTDGSAAPSISSTLPSGLTIPGYQTSLTFPLAINLGGTGVTSVTSVPAVSAWSGWDANKNSLANNFLPNYATTVTAATNTTLDVTSSYAQFFTGTTTQNVILPVTSTLQLGFPFYIVNNSSGNVTVKSSGGNNIQVMASGTTLYLTCILTSGTTAASWNGEYAFNGGSGSGTVNSGTQYDLAYYASTGTAVSGLTTANDGVLVTSAGGVPSISSTLPSALIIPGPQIDYIHDQVNNKIVLGIGATSSAVNSINMASSNTGNNPIIQAVGSDTNVQLQLLGQGTGGVSIQGVASNANASAGNVGEYITSNIPNGSAVSLTNGTAQNITSISVTAGDWDIFGNVTGFIAGVTNPDFIAWTSLTSATLPNASNYVAQYLFGTTISAQQGLCVPYLRVSVSSTTTVYLSAYSDFTVGTVTACGSIFARRVR